MYLSKLTEYGVAAYTECLDDMVKPMTKRRVDVVVLILAETRAPFGASAFSTQTVKVPNGAPAVGEDRKVGSHPPPKEGGGLCPLPDPTSFDDLPGEDLF